MKTIKNLLLSAALLIAGVTSAQETETRKVPAFNKLEIGGSFDAVLRQGSESSVTGSGNIDYRRGAQVKKIEVHGSGKINRKG